MDEDPSIGTDVLAALVDAAPDAMLVATEDGAIVLASAACARVLGRSPSELIGTDLTEFLPGTAPFCSMPGRGPDGRADGPAVLPTSLQRGDGSTVEVELAISTVGLGGRRYLCATVRDLRGRGKEEQRFRALLNAAPDATVIVNADGRIVLTNRQVESVFGYQGDELLGRAVETLIPGRFRPGHAQQRDDYASSPNVRGMGTGMDLFALRKDGTEFPVEVSLAPLRTEDGLLISAAIRDSTERLRVENSAARMREEFVATVSHELRSPLTSIIGYLELLHDLDSTELGDSARRMIEVIDRNAHRELRLVNDLLTLAQVQDHGLEMAADLVDVAAVARTAIEDARVAAERAELAVHLAVDDADLVVLGDQQRLVQVVTNLLTNAIKFTSTGRIEVSVARHGDVVELAVTDTGIGMDHEEIARAFDRHYRAPDVVDAQVPGAGLGLSIAKAIIEAHDGQIDIESAPWSGTRVAVLLPALDAAHG